MIKTIVILYFIIFTKNISAKEIYIENIYIVLGKCKMIPQKRVIEISSQNKTILSVEKDLLSNKICLKGKKLGSSKVNMLLFDGSGSVIWNVRVISPTKKGKRKGFNSNYKISTFDKDLEIPHRLPGWK